MSEHPELDSFRNRLRNLVEHRALTPHAEGDRIHFSRLSLEDVDELCREDEGYYFLIAAAGLNRTTLKRATATPEARIVLPRLRKAFAIKERLPLEISFAATLQKAAALRSGDLKRKHRGAVETLFRDRLKAEGIPLFMSPPVRRVPGVVVSHRKPDGVYPDPASGRAPRVYLEIKSLRRVSDDIQKRLYEVAEVSVEMKSLYGDLRLHGLNLKDTANVAGNVDHQSRLRQQIRAALPVVVALFICPKDSAEKYRPGAEAFIDRLFFRKRSKSASII